MIEDLSSDGNRILSWVLWILITALTVGFARYLHYGIFGDEAMNKIPEMHPRISFFQFVSRANGPSGPQWLLETCQQVGYIFRIPGTRWIFMKEAVLLSDPKVVRSFLENPKNQVKARQAYALFDQASCGETFFSTSGHRASHVRKGTAAAFSSGCVHRMTAVIDGILKDWVENRLEPLYVQQNEAVDIDKEMMLMTADVIAQVGFDYSISSSDEKEALVDKLKMVMAVSLRRRANPLKRGELFSNFFKDIREAKKASLDLQTLAKGMLQKCRENSTADPNTLVYIIANDPDYESDDERARDILIFFFAGFDTTAHSIAWTMLELGRNQKEQSNLRKCLLEWDGKEDKRHCPEVKNATKEALRLHPPAPLSGYRILGEDLKIPNSDMLIPKGTMCGVPLYSLLRHHEVFDDPHSYLPSRWNQPSEDCRKAFMPFLVGRRNCIGQALANTELTGVVSRLCSDYEFEVAEEGTSHFALTMQPRGCKLRFKRIVR